MYDSYEAALRRVQAIRARLGAWPGIAGPVCVHKGCKTRRCRHYDEQRWYLLYDPPDLEGMPRGQ